MPVVTDNFKLHGLEQNIFGDEAEDVQTISNIRYRLDCASYSEEGLEKFLDALRHGEPYSVVFADVRMPPGEDGVRLIERIWELAPRTQVVIMSAFSDYSWEDLIGRFGWSDRLIILRKPFDTITIKQLALMLTRRWFTENQLRTQRDELAELVREKERAEMKLARFREVMDQAGDAILMMDPDTGAVLDFNTTTLKLLGYEAEEMERLTIHDLVEKGRFDEWQDGFTLQEQLRTKDGRIIPAEVSLTLKIMGEAPTLLGLIRDISARLQAESDRRLLEQQLRHSQKMQTIGTLASGIAHDFNNILSPILVYTEMAIEDTESERIRQDLQQVSKAAYRARDLVQHILNFSHQVEKDRVPLKIHLIVQEALHLVRASLPSTISITREIPDCGQVLAGPTQIHQVLMNLCTNACHAMKEKGGVLSVKLAQRIIGSDALRLGIIQGEYGILEVGDTGTGMNEEVRTHIFEPFFTTKREGEGTGLGLAMVHDIIKAHNGAVEVFSREGAGSTFRVYLPIAAQEEGKHVADPSEPRGGKERVLFVDDEEMITRMMQELLSRYGYHVTTMTSSVDALSHFKEDPQQYDVVITDHTMPDLVGLKMAQEMLKCRPDLPIILCTGMV